MENNPTGNFINQYQLNNGTEDSGRDTLRDYLVILRMHWVAIALIFAAAMCVTIVYILTATNYYSTTTSIKINKHQESILSSSIFTDFGGQQADRFIANEIDLMQTYPIRQKAAKFILDTLQTIEDKSALYYLYSDPENISQGFRTVESMAKLLSDIVAIDQKRGLDVVTLVAESPSPIEATIISNLYARAYSEYSLELSRKDLTNTISFFFFF